MIKPAQHNHYYQVNVAREKSGLFAEIKILLRINVVEIVLLLLLVYSLAFSLNSVKRYRLLSYTN